jgi:hypothetical protein
MKAILVLLYILCAVSLSSQLRHKGYSAHSSIHITRHHCNRDSDETQKPVAFTIKDHVYCHSTQRHFSSNDYLQGTEISYSGPSTPSMLIQWQQQPKKVFLLAKDDNELLSHVLEGMQYLMAKDIQVSIDSSYLVPVLTCAV